MSEASIQGSAPISPADRDFNVYRSYFHTPKQVDSSGTKSLTHISQALSSLSSALLASYEHGVGCMYRSNGAMRGGLGLCGEPGLSLCVREHCSEMTVFRGCIGRWNVERWELVASCR